MRVPRSLAAVALATALAAGPGTAAAQNSAAEKADKLNNEGQALFGKNQFDAAVQKFREAILFSAEGRFYFNLCYTLNKLSKYREAITACEAVATNGASKPLQDKADKLLEALRAHVANTSEDPNLNPGPTNPDPNNPDPNNPDPNNPDPNNPDPNNPDPNNPDPNNPDPNNPDPNNPNPGGPGNAPAPVAGGVVEQKAPAPLGAYKWALGGELAFMNSGFGNPDEYASSGIGARFHADFMLSERRHLGVQGYFGITTVGKGDFDERLEVFDLGGAMFLHRRLKERIWLTGLAGLHLALLQPETIGVSGGSSAVALGGRGEAGLAFLFGARGQHALTVTAGLSIYGPASQGSADFDPADWGLDKAAHTLGLQFGYTARFSTPFGSAPVFTLE